MCIIIHLSGLTETRVLTKTETETETCIDTGLWTPAKCLTETRVLTKTETETETCMDRGTGGRQAQITNLATQKTLHPKP